MTSWNRRQVALRWLAIRSNPIADQFWIAFLQNLRFKLCVEHVNHKVITLSGALFVVRVSHRGPVKDSFHQGDALRRHSTLSSTLFSGNYSIVFVVSRLDSSRRNVMIRLHSFVLSITLKAAFLYRWGCTAYLVRPKACSTSVIVI